MKLFLSSYRLGDSPKKLIELYSDNKKIAVIANSMDFVSEKDRRESVQQEINDLLSLGLSPKELDLRNYFSKESELKEEIISYGGVWVRGGNTFILRRAMCQSGFDKIIKEKVKDPNFVYSGYSAGICVLSKTLRGLDIVDNPNIAPQRYNPDIIWDGIGIINFSIAPHYNSNHPESEMVDKTVEYFKENNLPFKTLRDGEVLIIN
jgi:dipeptidase E